MALAAITGASAGVGRAAARLFAARGYDLALIARGVRGLEGARDEALRAGRRAQIYLADVADHGRVFAVVDEIETQMGPIDVWVNNAMVSVFGPVSSVSPEEFKRVTEVTYLGFVYSTMAVLERMTPRNRGHIVQVSSALAFRGIPLQAAYCGAKHAIKGFTESLRTELAHEGIEVVVNMVHLPALNTPQFEWSATKVNRKPMPVPPIFQPELAAEAIHRAATQNVRDLTLTGNTKLVMLGNSLFPGLADRYLARNGHEDQLTDEPVASDRPSNLWEPADSDRDFGAHGSFGDRAKERSLYWRSAKALLGLRGRRGSDSEAPRAKSREG